MSDKSGIEIHKAYMIGLFDGEKLIIDSISGIIDDLRVEREKEIEAQE